MKYIYVITCGSEFLKVGVAVDPSKRLKELQTGAPLRLRLYQAIKIDTAKLAYKYEKAVHRQLAPFATAGEWFKVAPPIAVEAITFVIAGPPKNKDAAIDIQAARHFRSTLRCPYCAHQAQTNLTNKQIWKSTFRCKSCKRAVEGRRFFIRRVA